MTVKIGLDKDNYDQGATITATVAEDYVGKRTMQVVDSTGAAFSKVSGSDRGQGAQWTSKAGAAHIGSNSVTVVLTHARDGLTETASAIYSVGSQEPPAPPALLGTSFGGAVGTKKIDVSREYDIANVNAKAIGKGVRFLDASSRDDTKNGITVVNRIKAALIRYPQIEEVDYCHENETDRTDHRGGSDADMKRWAAECKEISDAIYDEFTDGSVKFAVDMTGFGTKEGRSQKMMQYLADAHCFVEVYGSSMYPPGRNKVPPVKSDFADFIRPSIDVAADFGIEYVSCMEISTPMSGQYDRPTYVATWAPEFVRYAKSKGVKPRHFSYWNGTKGSGEIDNRFAADGTTDANVGKTEKAFFESL